MPFHFPAYQSRSLMAMNFLVGRALPPVFTLQAAGTRTVVQRPHLAWDLLHSHTRRCRRHVPDPSILGGIDSVGYDTSSSTQYWEVVTGSFKQAPFTP